MALEKRCMEKSQAKGIERPLSFAFHQPSAWHFMVHHWTSVEKSRVRFIFASGCSHDPGHAILVVSCCGSLVDAPVDPSFAMRGIGPLVTRPELGDSAAHFQVDFGKANGLRGHALRR